MRVGCGGVQRENATHVRKLGRNVVGQEHVLRPKPAIGVGGLNLGSGKIFESAEGPAIGIDAGISGPAQDILDLDSERGEIGAVLFRRGGLLKSGKIENLDRKSVV